jgi:hypothetical protein
MPTPLLPDAEELAKTALAAQSAITTICGSRIDTVIPNPAVYPLIRVTKVGDLGPDNEGRADVVVQVECWADSDATASLLARTVQACRIDLRGTQASGWLALTDVTSGPIATPDPDSSRSRYILDLIMSVGY